MATRPPRRPSAFAPRTDVPDPGTPRRFRRFRMWLPQRRWMRFALIFVGVPALALFIVGAYYWVSFGRLIDAKLGGDQRPVPRIFGRAFEIRAGRGLSLEQLRQRLNEVGYAEREKAAGAGEFSVSGNSVTLAPRTADTERVRLVRVDIARGPSPVVTRVSEVGGKEVERVTLEPPLLATLAPGQRRRYVPLGAIPKIVVNAILAIEDHRFYEHPGVDPIRALGAMWTNTFGNKPYLEGASTLTQQIVKNTFLTSEQTYRRKIQEQFMALVLESRFTKDQILELYLNDVTLGQRGPFEIHGVAEASRIFFGKDVSNLSVAEAATIAGIIQSPSRLSPFRNPDRAKERRNIVLKEMVSAGYLDAEAANLAAAEPFKIQARALENEAPYFIDYVSDQIEEKYAGLLKKNTAVDVYTTLDLQMQRAAQEAIATGMAIVDKQLPKKKQGLAQVALVAVDPRTGDVLAMVGGRAYSQTQYNRAVTTKRQPGSIFKPFVYLTAFDRTATEGSPVITPASVFVDEPTIFKDGEGNDYAPGNYHNEYDGPITVRKALAQSRNIVAIKVAEATGLDRVADLWKKVGVGTPAKPYPSMALGVFEASPLDMATAYTLFSNGGSVRPLQTITRIVDGGRTVPVPPGRLKPVARADATYLITNLLRGAINEGTGAGARSAYGFILDAAGKTGTTNDLRDAWYAGFTPELLTVVWVGLDDNQPIGLSGAQAALPIWATFMKNALAGRPSQGFDTPQGIVFATIDKDTGLLATPACPKTITEAFINGTEPREHCDVHSHGMLSRMRNFFGRIVR
jgi:penicillin-binding protein 1B